MAIVTAGLALAAVMLAMAGSARASGTAAESCARNLVATLSSLVD